MPRELLFSLSKNESLGKVGDHIRSTPVNWEQIAEVVNELDIPANRLADDGGLVGLTSEIHLKLTLDQLAQEDTKINAQPIPEGTKIGNLRFHRTLSDGYRVWNLARRVDQVEYDQIIIADELPTVMEAKIGTAKKALGDAMANKRIDQLLLPLGMFFRARSFGYMVVVAQDSISEDDVVQTRFTEKGGLIVPFSQTKRQFLDGLQEIRLRIQRGTRSWSFGN